MGTTCKYVTCLVRKKIGYTPNDMHVAAYDWRLSPYFLEKRDSYLTRLKSTIETMKSTSDEKVALMSHSYGKRVRPLFNSIQPIRRNGIVIGGDDAIVTRLVVKLVRLLCFTHTLSNHFVTFRFTCSSLFLQLGCCFKRCIPSTFCRHHPIPMIIPPLWLKLKIANC